MGLDMYFYSTNLSESDSKVFKKVCDEVWIENEERVALGKTPLYKDSFEREKIINERINGKIPDEITEKVGYFRKFGTLNGIIQRMWVERMHSNGEKVSIDDFNCKRFYLTESDLDELEERVKTCRENNEFHDGFFWNIERTKEDVDELWEELKEIIYYAREELKNNNFVYYYAWW